MFVFLKAALFLMEEHFALGLDGWGLLNCNIHKQKNKFTGKKDQIYGYKRWELWGRELDDGSQKVKTFSYKINGCDIIYNMINIINNAIYYKTYLSL